METPDAGDDISQQYLVHLSNVMAENSTKIAGNLMVQYNFNFNLECEQKGSFIEPEGMMIRSRITLHHCLGGVVPQECHGITFNTLFGDIKPTSPLYTDKDICAYLDPLSEFKGELIGGELYDMFTIDRHVYKEKSIVIVPHHRVDNFRSNNPGFKGKCIEFDPEQIRIADKVDEVIHEYSTQATFKEINNKIVSEIISTGGITIAQEVLDRFKANNLLYQHHNNTPFKALEELLSPFKAQIRAARSRENRIICPADQVHSRIGIIRSLLDLIVDLTLPRLNQAKYFVVRSWREDTLNWLNLFELDANLRKTFNTSIFINNPHFDLFMKNRANPQELIKLSASLPLERAENPKNNSQGLFPELFEVYILQKPDFHKFLYDTDLSVFMKLKDLMVEKGFGEYGHGLILLRLLNDLEFKEYCFLEKRMERLIECLNEISPSPRLQVHVREIIESFLTRDNSYNNHKTLNLLNSEVGKLLQKKVFGKETTLGYMDLLHQYKGTKILFADLNTLKSPEGNQLISNSAAAQEVKFIEIVRQWMLKNARMNPKSQNKTISKFSLRNVQSTVETIVNKLFDYRRHFWGPTELLSPLIEQGCFVSWADLFHRTLPLEILTTEEAEIILSEYSDFCLYSIYGWINEYVQNKNANLRDREEQFNKMLDNQKKMYQHIAEPHPYPAPSRKPEFIFTSIGINTEQPVFTMLTDKMFINAIQDLPLKDVRALSATSKIMYNLGHTPFMWHCISQQEIVTSLPLCIRDIRTNVSVWWRNLFDAFRLCVSGEMSCFTQGARPVDGSFGYIYSETDSGMAWYAYNKLMSFQVNDPTCESKSKFGVTRLKKLMQPIFNSAIVPLYRTQ